MKNYTHLIAGIINILTAIIHTAIGQYTLAVPLLHSNMADLEKSQMLGVWHMATVVLFASSIIVLGSSINKFKVSQDLLAFIGWSYLFYGFSFLLISLLKWQLALQWTLLLPIGLLVLFGNSKFKMASKA
ncbi:hypothetical protein [Maribacter sp. 2307ULW6-5]|uniref:hypothetical protein n=1 Tax=Maribacter sp. 2307ULW6-5 TaxID=3386275 RepID=UPI0039BC5CDA